MSTEPIGLGAFVRAAGDGLADAQDDIAGAQLDTTAMAVSEATLTAKVLVDIDSSGTVRVAPVGRSEIQTLPDAAGSLSAVTVNFVALTDAAEPPGASAPAIDRDQAIDEVAGRDDVARLARVLGPLDFGATLVPERAMWLVTATDQQGRTVREVLIGGGS